MTEPLCKENKFYNHNIILYDLVLTNPAKNPGAKPPLTAEWEVRDSKIVAVVVKHEDKPKQLLKKQR
jgi:hypothetical protein